MMIQICTISLFLNIQKLSRHSNYSVSGFRHHSALKCYKLTNVVLTLVTNLKIRITNHDLPPYHHSSPYLLLLLLYPYPSRVGCVCTGVPTVYNQGVVLETIPLLNVTVTNLIAN